MSELFYVVIHPRGDKTKIQVVDISHSVSYEKSDYSLALSKDFAEKQEAINIARYIAKNYSLEYVNFSSRYGNEDESTYDFLLGQNIDFDQQ